MGVTSNENCSFCGTMRETIEHVFWHCPITQTFWLHFENLINEKCPNAHNMRMTDSLVILGSDKNIKIDPTFYFILVLAKQFIYKCKIGSSIPNIINFKKMLSSRYKIEEYNAKLSLSLHTFNMNWIMYKNLF